MAWLCTGKSNVELVENLIKAGIVQPGRVAQAMKATDRKHYVPDVSSAYQDSPQTIGYGATISAPHMHAYALEALEEFLRPGDRCLDVGCGSGYLTAVIHRLLGDRGLVVGIDHLRPLTSMSERNLRADSVDTNTEDKNIGVRVVLGDGRQGYPPSAPYQAIHVGAASPVLPETLIGQLASPGRMFIPVGTDRQSIWVVDKDANGKVTKDQVMDVRVSDGALRSFVVGGANTDSLDEIQYVPLTDAGKQWKA